MEERLTVSEYFRRPETLRPEELVYGFVHEPPAPTYGHQSVVTRLCAVLDPYVRGHRLGRVCVSPIDVVLDEERALVVQPDLVFVTLDRIGIIQERIVGSPDLVVEVLSWGTARRDRTVKLGWYRRYGVRECWLVDPIAKQVDVFNFERSAEPRIFTQETTLQSGVLAELEVRVASLFEGL